MIEVIIFDRDGVLIHFDMSGAGKVLLALLPVSSLPDLSLQFRAFGKQTSFPSGRSGRSWSAMRVSSRLGCSI